MYVRIHLRLLVQEEAEALRRQKQAEEDAARLAATAASAEAAADLESESTFAGIEQDAADKAAEKLRRAEERKLVLQEQQVAANEEREKQVSEIGEVMVRPPVLLSNVFHPLREA